MSLESCYMDLRNGLEYKVNVDVLVSMFDNVTFPEMQPTSVDCLLVSIPALGKLSPVRCYQILKSDNLYEALQSLGIDCGMFAVAVCMYAIKNYSLKIELPEASEVVPDNSQNVFNILTQRLLSKLEVFYD